MGRLNSDALSARWRTDEGAALAEEAFARLVAGLGLAGLGLSEHEGRVDLRGLPAPVSGRLRRFEGEGRFVEVPGTLVELRAVSLVGLDLSGAVLPSLRLFGVRIEGCRLDGASLRDWRMWDTVVADSSFAGVDLRQAVVGSWHEGRRDEWRRVDFQRADLRHAVSWAALFEDCDFARANLDGVKFEQCALARCRFAGRLRRVAFDGRELPDRAAPSPLDGVDFRAARSTRSSSSAASSTARSSRTTRTSS